MCCRSHGNTQGGSLAAPEQSLSAVPDCLLAADLQDISNTTSAFAFFISSLTVFQREEALWKWTVQILCFPAGERMWYFLWLRLVCSNLFVYSLGWCLCCLFFLILEIKIQKIAFFCNLNCNLLFSGLVTEDLGCCCYSAFPSINQ